MASFKDNPKYIDFAYEDWPIPRYLRRQWDQSLSRNELPNMRFTGRDLGHIVTVANALARQLGWEIEALVFNKESSRKGEAKGEKTLSCLKQLLDSSSTSGIKKIYLFQDIGTLPKDRFDEFVQILEAASSKFIINTWQTHPLNQKLRHWPQIAIEFPVNHSPEEREAYSQHCKEVLKRHGLTRSNEDLESALQNEHHFLLSLLGKEYLKPYQRQLEYVEIIRK